MKEDFCSICGESFPTQEEDKICIIRKKQGYGQTELRYHTKCFKDVAGDGYIPDVLSIADIIKPIDFSKLKAFSVSLNKIYTTPTYIASKKDLEEYATIKIPQFFHTYAKSSFKTSKLSFTLNGIRKTIENDLKLRTPLGIISKVNIGKDDIFQAYEVNISYKGANNQEYIVTVGIPYIEMC